MPFFDLPQPELERYEPAHAEPAGFDDFWASTLAETREHALDARFEPVDVGLTELVTEDVTFAGFGGQPIRGWVVRPRSERPLPAVVHYIGYGGGRGLPGEWTALAAAGFAVLVMDVRGQGSGWRRGDTDDEGSSGPHQGGFLTLGADRPERLYYRRLIADAVRAVEAAAAHPAIDPERIAVAGGSQGGALAQAVAGLAPAHLGVRLRGAVIDVPFLTHIRRAAGLVATDPYAEIARYLRAHRGQEEALFGVLDHVDGLSFAARARVPALYSVALMDDVCPPSTVYAAFNRYGGEKEIRVYPFNGHEGGGAAHEQVARAFLQRVTA